MRLGRYEIHFGPVIQFQTKMPVTVRHFLWFWFIREARPTDVDKKPRFPDHTEMEYGGRHYRYFKANKDMKRGEVVLKREQDCSSNR